MASPASTGRAWLWQNASIASASGELSRQPADEPRQFIRVEKIQATIIIAIDEPSEAFRSDGYPVGQFISGVPVHFSILPASTFNVWPVTYRASSEASHNAALATSEASMSFTGSA